MLPSHIQAHRDSLNARLDDTGTVAEQIDLLNELAWIEREFDAVHSQELCGRAQHLATTGEYQAQPYTRGVIAALRTMGYLYLLSGFEASSTNESLRALELLRDTPDIPLEIKVRRNAAWAQLWIGELEQAMRLALPALEMSRQTNDKLREATLQTLATRDPLTHILNRRHFVALAHEHLETVQSGSPVSLILFDLDHFKTINDTFGHTVGDQVLQTIARVVRDNLREHDLLARFGGEEFILLLPGTPSSDAQQLAERLRELVQSQTISSYGASMRISISLGVAQVPPDESASVLALIQAADRAVYQAKNNGRNQTVVAHWTGPLSAASSEIIPDSSKSPESISPER